MKNILPRKLPTYPRVTPQRNHLQLIRRWKTPINPMYISAVTRVMPLTMIITRENINTSPINRLARPGASFSGTPALTARASVAPKTTMAPPANPETR